MATSFSYSPAKIQTKNVSGIVEADETFFLGPFKGQCTIEHRKLRSAEEKEKSQVRKIKYPC
jgi:hypothetical protein